MTANRLTPWLSTLRSSFVGLAALVGLLVLPACVVDSTESDGSDDGTVSDISDDLEVGDPIDIGPPPGMPETEGDDSEGPQPTPWREAGGESDDAPDPPDGFGVAASSTGTAKDEP